MLIDHEKYVKQLQGMCFDNMALNRLKQSLMEYQYHISAHETFSWVCCVLALEAAYHKNIGVGAILVKHDKIIYEASNEMFYPYFRSDGHPEMMILSQYEAEHQRVNPKEMHEVVMYSSLEPCPMCMTRISTTSIKKVYHIADHPNSAMTGRMKDLPILWQIFCEDVDFLPATCGPNLKEIAYQILDISAQNHMPQVLISKTEGSPDQRIKKYIDNL